MNERQKRAHDFVQSFEALSRSEFNKFQDARRKKILDEYLTQKCIVDYWTCLKYIYRDAIQHYWPDMHGPKGLSGYLQDWTRTDRHGSKTSVAVKFVVMSREYCKTQSVIVWDVWQWIKDPNRRGLVRAYNDTKAEEITRTCKNIIGKAWFQNRFPWVKPATENGKRILWANDQIMLQREDMLRTPSMEACGIGTDPTGGHFDFGHIDDFEVKQNTMYTPDRTKMIQAWRSDGNLFVAGSQRVVCGTPWHMYGLINAVGNRLNIEDVSEGGDFRNHEYDVFWQPATNEQDFSPFDIPDARLMDDRVTFRCDGEEFPTVMNDLQTCQARITLFDPSTNDTTSEVREVVWNNSNTLRVNRPIPEYLGQPMQLYIGNEKPAAPNRVTLDVTDCTPAIACESPSVIKGYNISRASLPKKERDQGPFVYSAQMKLKPMASDALVFSIDSIERINAEDLPDGVDYRACDFATPSKTAASSVISYGRWTSRHFIITKIVRKNKMANSAKILELVVGAHRAMKKGSPLRCTFFEKAQIETTLMDYILQAQRDPYEYFSALGGFYAKVAENEFRDSGPVTFARRTLPRPPHVTKNMRIAEIQPFVSANCLKIVAGCEGEEAFFDEVGRFTLDSGDTFDVLDTIRDMIAEGRPQARSVVDSISTYTSPSFDAVQARAFTARNPAGFRGGGI